MVPMAPGRALASVKRDKLDIATDVIGHIGRRGDISDMVVGAQVQTPVALRTFAGAEVDGSRTQAEAIDLGRRLWIVLIFVLVGRAR